MKRIALITMAAGLALGACSDDPATPKADTDTGTLEETTAVEETSEPTDTLEPQDTEDVDTTTEVEEEVVDDTTEGDTTETTEPGTFVLGTADLPTEFVFKGVWAGQAGRIVAVGNDGVVASRGPDGVWKSIARVEGASLLNAIHGVDETHLWAVGTGGAILPGTVTSFGTSEACEHDTDCNDSDLCTNDHCVEGVCVVEPTGATGCCGATVASYDFDNGTLQGWALPAADKIGPWTWQSVAIPERATSGTNAMYFGNPLAVPPTYDAAGVQVAGVALSPQFRLPQTGTATLRFNVFLDAEPDIGFDNLWIEVQSGTDRIAIWDKTDLGGVPTFGFVAAEADLTPYKGKLIALRVHFDSTDGTFNTFEGPYLDDVHVDTACTTGGSAAGQTGPTLWGVYATSRTSAFAVGKDGTILSYNGVDWKPAKGADPSAVWNGISGSGTNKIALVGNLGVGLASFGSGLQTVTTGTSNAITSVHTNDGSQWFAVGDQGLLIHGTGTTWTVDDIGLTVKLNDVHGVSNDNVWAVGDKGTVVHWDGTSWTKVETDTTLNLLGVWVDQNGDPNITGKTGILIKRTESGLTTTATLFSGGDLNDIWGSSDGTFYAAVGTSGQIMVYQNGAWAKSTSNTSQTLEAVYGTSASDVWAVGRSGTLLHWDGSAWTRSESPSTASVNAIWGSAADNYYAVGSGGLLMVFTGTVWEAITTPALNNLRAVFGRTPNDVWAVGANGSVIHYGGLGWGASKVAGVPNADGGEDPITDELHAVWAASATDAWAVGAAGRMLHWDGSIWNIVETDWTTTLRGIYGLASNDIWAVGNEGLILHWNGVEWEQIETGSIATLHAIHGDGVRHVVVVGDIGTVLELQRD